MEACGSTGTKSIELCGLQAHFKILNTIKNKNIIGMCKEFVENPELLFAVLVFLLHYLVSLFWFLRNNFFTFL